MISFVPRVWLIVLELAPVSAKGLRPSRFLNKPFVGERTEVLLNHHAPAAGRGEVSNLF